MVSIAAMHALMRIGLTAAVWAALWTAPVLLGQVVLSEFQASNTGNYRDEDGDSADWIELCNTGDQPVNLRGWRLTDEPGLLTKWQFPSTNIAAGQLLVVFASDKDRRRPGSPLHTNFRLSAGGDYLALVKPGGEIATSYAPAYPAQADGLSYGLPTGIQEVTLLRAGADGAFYVPTDGTLWTGWTLPGFNDTAWTQVKTGAGFDLNGTPASSLINSDVADLMWNVNASACLRLPFIASHLGELRAFKLRIRYSDGFVGYLNGVAVAARNAAVAATGGTLADSVAGWAGSGQQGFNNWTYGFYDRSADEDAVYDANSDFDSANPSWAWNGVAWVLGPSNPPWDTISATGWQPNGSNSGGAHWPIRRWLSSTAGTITCRIAFAKENVQCGSGVTLRVLQNGLEKFQWTAAYNDAAGIRTNLELQGVQEGDYIDFALDPMGTDGSLSDACDSAAFAVVIDQSPSDGTTWNSTATATRPQAEGAAIEEISLSRHQDLLVAGTNLLAFHALNNTSADPYFVILPELVASRVGLNTEERAYFTEPTPGRENGPGALTLGPIIDSVVHAPLLPAPGEDLIVWARVRQSIRPVGAASLTYRVMYGPQVVVSMHDDGKNDDGAAGDSIYGARLPLNAARAGQMVRYFVTATDSAGNKTRVPAYSDPTDGPEYFGTVLSDGALTNSRLPVLHWFLRSPGAADSEAGARCSLFFEGEFYDNVLADVHGQSTRSFPKKSYDLHFNSGAKFRWSPDAPKVKGLNLLTTWADKSHLRSILAYDTYRDSGAASHFAFPVRVQRNGAFFSVANVVESGDGDFLERLGLDRQGALYKMYNSAESVVSAEKKTRKHEGTADLQALIDGLTQDNQTARQTFMFDHVDIPATVNFLAAKIITADVDCCHKNYYLFRDSDGSGEWQAMPWDVDLSFGRVWSCGSPCWQYFDEALYTNQSINVGTENNVFKTIYQTTATRQMFLRRLRSLMDGLLQPPGTAPANDLFRIKSAVLRDEIAPDAALDQAKWGTWGNPESIGEATARIWNEFLPGRRAFLFNRMLVSNRGEIPLAQPDDVRVEINGLEYRSTSGDPLQEWLSITNANASAVDISDWLLAGGVRFKFKPGTVIPGRSTLFVSPDVRKFRARNISPKGGERRLVVGPYEGNLSAWGETLTLTGASGRLVSSNTFAGNPSDAQQFLRISELFYNPDQLLGNADLDAQQFEFVELRNIGPVALDLRGVRFTEGIQFDFTSAAATQLPPGARVLVVSNTNAFALRYGSGLPVAGSFVGNLDNAGESLRLEDAFGDQILEFEYDDRWQPATDGLGLSLVIIRDTLPWQSWDLKDSWRACSLPGGSPGRADGDTVNPMFNQLVVQSVSEGCQLRYAGMPGQVCELQRSLDLIEWRKVAEKSVPPQGAVEFSEPLSTHGAAYYRILQR